MKKLLTVLLMTLLAALPLAAQNPRTALDAAVYTARIHSFTEILRNSGIPIETLRSDELTFLIPVDISFYDLTPDQYKTLLGPENKDLAKKYIEAHIIKGKYSLEQLASGSYKTLAGTTIKVSKPAGKPMEVNGLPVFQGDIAGTNGYAHLIHGFLLKP